MRLFIIVMGLMIGGAMTAHSQETAPGDTCTVGETNHIRLVGGPETSGIVRLMRCDGTDWNTLYLFDENYRFFLEGTKGVTEPALSIRRDESENEHTTIAFRPFSLSSNRPEFNIGVGLGDDYFRIGAYDGSTGKSDLFVIDTDSSFNSFIGIGTISPNVALDVIGDIEFTGTIRDMSDRRQKADIRVLTNALSAISKIDGVSFKMKDGDDSTELGLIAQDVEAVYPELVFTGRDGIKALNYQGMIGPLVEAVKELDAQNAALRAELEAKDSHLARMIHEISNRMDVIEGKRRPPLKPYNP